jgi:hypothetical protein
MVNGNFGKCYNVLESKPLDLEVFELGLESSHSGETSRMQHFVFWEREKLIDLDKYDDNRYRNN